MHTIDDNCRAWKKNFWTMYKIISSLGQLTSKPMRMLRKIIAYT